MEKILLKLGLSPDATEEQALEAIGRLQEEKNTVTLARITAAVKTAIHDRRLTAAKKDKYISLGKQIGYESLSALFADMTPAQKPLDLIRPSGGRGAGADVKLTWTSATPTELADLRDNNREEYIRLYREHFGFDPTF